MTQENILGQICAATPHYLLRLMSCSATEGIASIRVAADTNIGATGNAGGIDVPQNTHHLYVTCLVGRGDGGLDD